MEKLLTIQEVSALVQAKVSTIYKWVHMGFIPHIKVGRLVRFQEKEIMVWLEKKKCRGRLEKMIEIKI